MAQEQKNKIIKLEVSRNYIIEVYRTPPNVIKYVRKEIIDSNGFRNIATFAIVRDGTETKTVITSFWRPANKPSAKRLLKLYLKKYPRKIKFLNSAVKDKYIKSNTTTRSVAKSIGITKTSKE